MVGYLQIYNKGYLYLLNLVIVSESRCCIHAYFNYKLFIVSIISIVWFFEIQNFWEISGQSLRVNKTSGRWRSCFTYEGGNLLFQEWPLHGGYYLLLGWNLPCGSSQVGFQSENILKKCRPNVYTCTKTSSRTEVLLAGGVEPNHFEGV